MFDPSCSQNPNMRWQDICLLVFVLLVQTHPHWPIIQGMSTPVFSVFFLEVHDDSKNQDLCIAKSLVVSLMCMSCFADEFSILAGQITIKMQFSREYVCHWVSVKCSICWSHSQLLMVILKFSRLEN